MVACCVLRAMFDDPEESIKKYMHELTDSARTIGAVNTVLLAKFNLSFHKNHVDFGGDKGARTTDWR